MLTINYAELGKLRANDIISLNSECYSVIEIFFIIKAVKNSLYTSKKCHMFEPSVDNPNKDPGSGPVLTRFQK
jgi:hypothetical protein